MNKSTLILIIIIIIAFFLRTVLLVQVPSGLANDELNIIMNAQSFLKTGQNIPGVVTGIFGTKTGDLSGGIHSEVSSYLLIPWILLFGFSLLTIKLPFVFASIGVVYISYLLVKRMINTEAGIKAAFLSAINPWSVHFGRSAYESIFSAFFYLLALYLIISLKGWKIFWSFPFFILGFFSYFSAKTLLLPLLIVSILTIKFFKSKESLKPTLALSTVIIFFLLVYGLILSTSPAGSRFQELKNQNIKDLVDSKRTASINLPMTQIFENKFIEDLRIRLKASLEGLSPNLLFLDGQPESIPSLSIPDHGPLYLIDLPLIIAGLTFLARINLGFLFLFLGLIATTLVPNFLNLAGTTYMIRTVILFPILTILSAIGLYSIKNNLNRNIRGWALFVLISFSYLFLFGHFIFQYFGRLPIDRNEGWFFHQRILTKYIKLSLNENPTIKINVVTEEPKYTFYRYLFFSGIYVDSKKIQEINDKLTRGDYSLPNLIITNKCPSSIDDQEFTTSIIDVRLKCLNMQGNSISSIKDAGDKYVIVNDKLCNSLVKKDYPLVKTFSDLNIEALSKEDFCTNFITISKYL